MSSFDHEYLVEMRGIKSALERIAKALESTNEALTVEDDGS